MTHATRDDEQRDSIADPLGPDATPETELRATIRLALPVVLVQIGLMFMGVVDTVMVGHVSATVLAAVALGNLYFFNAIILGNGTLMALDPIIAQAVGADDMESASRTMQRGLLVAVGLTLFTALLLLPAHALLVLTRQQPEIIPDTTAYIRISIPGVLPFLLFVVFRQTLQALHRVAPIVWTIVGANLSNAALNWVFVYGHLGSPALGAAGSALATLVSRWLMALALPMLAWSTLRPHLATLRREAWELSLELSARSA
jgi:MATE family multidrug resistance protein